MEKIFKTALILTIVSFTVTLPSYVHAGKLRVLPIKLFFDQSNKADTITLVNDGEGDLKVQMRLFEWTQNELGEDKYVESSDLIFFPRITVIEPQQRKVVRVGPKELNNDLEKTYRLYIDEIPDRKKKEKEGISIGFSIRFALPIFIKAAKESVSGEIEKVYIDKEKINVTIKNTGNTHFRIKEVAIRGENKNGDEVYSSSIDGWYLLNNVSKTFSAEISNIECKKINNIDVTMAAENLNLQRRIDVGEGVCKK